MLLLHILLNYHNFHNITFFFISVFLTKNIYKFRLQNIKYFSFSREVKKDFGYSYLSTLPLRTDIELLDL